MPVPGTMYHHTVYQYRALCGTIQYISTGYRVASYRMSVPGIAYRARRQIGSLTWMLTCELTRVTAISSW
eukprot:3223483-Rhodomonas_salina.1